MSSLIKSTRTPEHLEVRFRQRIRREDDLQQVLAVCMLTCLAVLLAGEKPPNTISGIIFVVGNLLLIGLFRLRGYRRVVVRVGRREITIAHGYLVRRPQRRFPTAAIQQLYTGKRPGGHRGTLSFYLAARRRDGTELLIIDHAEEIGILAELEVLLERELDLTDEPTLSLSDTGQSTEEMENTVELFEVEYERQVARPWPSKGEIRRAEQQLEGAKKSLARQYERLGR